MLLREEATTALSGGLKGGGVHEQVAQVGLNVGGFVVGADEEHGVGGEVGVAFRLRDQAGQSVVPEAELARGGFSHGRVPQVHGEIGLVEGRD